MCRVSILRHGKPVISLSATTNRSPTPRPTMTGERGGNRPVKRDSGAWPDCPARRFSFSMPWWRSRIMTGSDAATSYVIAVSVTPEQCSCCTRADDTQSCDGLAEAECCAPHDGEDACGCQCGDKLERASRGAHSVAPLDQGLDDVEAGEDSDRRRPESSPTAEIPDAPAMPTCHDQQFRTTHLAAPAACTIHRWH